MGSATTQAIAAGSAALAAASGDRFALGRELLEARDAIAGSAQLRAVLVDQGADATAKSALVSRVFGGLGEQARTVLAAMTGARWSASEDLLDGLEELGIRAIADSAGDGAEVIDELAAFQRAVTAAPELEYAVGSTLVPGEQKAAVVERLLSGRATAQTVTILTALVGRANGRRIGGLIKRATTLVADQGGQVVATVRTAAPLSPTQSAQIRSMIAAEEQRDAVLTEIIDPSVIGGVRISVGDRVIDASVATRLNDLRLALVG